jgi:hypothetical protein
MPLILKQTEQLAAQILNQLKKLKIQYEQPIMTIDAIMNEIISLPNEILEDLGNQIGSSDLDQLLQAHAAQANGINQLSLGIEQIIASIEQRQPSETRTASTSSLDERLFSQGREIVLSNAGVFSVVNLDPENLNGE